MFNLTYMSSFISSCFYKSIVIVHFCNVEYEQIVLPTGHMFHGIPKNRDDERDKNDIDTIWTQCRPTLRFRRCNKIDGKRLRHNVDSMSVNIATSTM